MNIKRIIYIAGAVIIFLIFFAVSILFAFSHSLFSSIFPIALLAIFGMFFIAYLLGLSFNESHLKDTIENVGDTCLEEESVGNQTNISQHNSDIVERTVSESTRNNLNKEWCTAMYERYGTRWHTYFDGITYPADKASRAELVAMAWEIASITMDYILTENNDPALLKANKDMTKVITNKDSFDKLDLKEFYNDPSTVPAKVIVVYDVLSQMLASKQTLDVIAFGHLIHVSK